MGVPQTTQVVTLEDPPFSETSVICMYVCIYIFISIYLYLYNQTLTVTQGLRLGNHPRLPTCTNNKLSGPPGPAVYAQAELAIAAESFLTAAKACKKSILIHRNRLKESRGRIHENG